MTANLPDADPDADAPPSRTHALTDDEAGSGNAYRAFLFWAIIAFLLTVLNRFAGFFVRIPPFGTITGHLIALAYLAAVLFTLLQLTYAAARLPLRSGWLIGLGLALAIPMGIVLLLQNYRLPAPLWLSLTANNLFLPFAAALVGAGIGRIIRHPNTLLAGAGFAIFFDFVVVTMGTVAQLMKTNSKLIAAVSLGGSNQSSATMAELPSWMRQRSVEPITGVTIGPADILFLALFQAAVHHQRLSARATFWWMFGLLMLALALVETTSLPVPALIPMGIAILIANARHAAFSKTEKRDLVIGGFFALFCAALIVFISQRAIGKTQPVAELGFTIGPVSRDTFYVEPTGDPKRVTMENGTLGQAAGLIGGDQILRVNNFPTSGLYGNNDLYRVLDETPAKGLVLKVRLRDTPTVRDVFLPPARPLTDDENKRFGKLPRRVRDTPAAQSDRIKRE